MIFSHTFNMLKYLSFNSYLDDDECPPYNYNRLIIYNNNLNGIKNVLSCWEEAMLSRYTDIFMTIPTTTIFYIYSPIFYTCYEDNHDSHGKVVDDSKIPYNFLRRGRGRSDP